MLFRIASKEFTDTLRDGRFRWSAAIVLTLVRSVAAIGPKKSTVHWNWGARDGS